MLVDRGVSGIIFVSGRHSDTGGDVTRYQRLRERGVPLVTINGNAPTIRAPGFTVDDRAAARIAVEHLVSLGHRRIGLATGPLRMVPAQRKRAGYEDALRSALPDRPLRVFETLYSYEGGTIAAGRLIDQGCTGIVCGSDIMALGVISGARGRGLSVPHDLSVIGYDDSALIPMTNPPLTTVRQPRGRHLPRRRHHPHVRHRRRGRARHGDALRPGSHRARLDGTGSPVAGHRRRQRDQERASRAPHLGQTPPDGGRPAGIPVGEARPRLLQGVGPHDARPGELAPGERRPTRHEHRGQRQAPAAAPTTAITLSASTS